MNHTSEHVLAFSDELRQILSVLSEHLNLHVRNADLIHKGTMDLIERLLTASEAIDEKYRELNMAPGNPMSPVEYGAKGGFIAAMNTEPSTIIRKSARLESTAQSIKSICNLVLRRVFSVTRRPTRRVHRIT
jgi:hypothetical protein